MPAPISVIIPTLDAASALPGTAAALMEGLADGLITELVISDGGSTDDTREVASGLGAVWLEGAAGRGGQIARGVDAAKGEWVLILHADTLLSPGWAEEARHHIAEHADKAGWFRLRFRAEGLAPKLVAAGANLRARWLGLPWGDQGLLLSKTTLARAGGVPNLPLMEDVALARRLRGRLRPLAAEARTSAERYRCDGWARRVLLNFGNLARYALGANPERLAARYRKD